MCKLSVYKQFSTETTPFLGRLLENCTRVGLDLSEMLIDHVCIRVGDNYEMEKRDLIDEYKAKVIGIEDTIIWWRPITVLQMPIPLVYETSALYTSEQVIEILELPAPKESHTYKNGVQHAELYPYYHDEINDLQAYLKQRVVRYNHLAREEKYDSTFNPTIAHSFWNDMEIKIHPHPIQQVIEREQNNLAT